MALNSFQLENLTSGLNTGITTGKGSGTIAGVERVTKQEMHKNGMSPSPTQEPGVGFLDLLEKSVNQVNQYQVQSDTAIQELIAGRTKNVHEAMLAIERADMSLKMLMQVRNKVLDAYREIMKMQV
jgi:flagellar hook-basal body complex protein FliE